MQLSYRGANYNYEPSAIDLIEGKVTDKFRGQSWRFNYPRHLPVPQSSVEMSYRGGSQKPVSPESTTTVAPTEGAIAPSLTALNAPKKFQETWAATHRSNLCRNVEHRLGIARQRGDQALVQLLEQELQQILCPVG